MIAGDKERPAGRQQIDHLHARPDASGVGVDQTLVLYMDREAIERHHHQRIKGDANPKRQHNTINRRRKLCGSTSMMLSVNSVGHNTLTKRA